MRVCLRVVAVCLLSVVAICQSDEVVPNETWWQREYLLK
jgi:hypothetical protein